jgi:hypothetical protein
MDAFEALKALAIQGPMLANTLESALKTGRFAEDPGLKKALKIAKKLNGELQDFIEKRELSITKDVDFVAKSIRNSLRPYIGKYNITKTFIEMLRMQVCGLLKQMMENGQLVQGDLISLVQSEDQPDTVLVTIQLLVPYPCNYIRVTLLI